MSSRPRVTSQGLTEIVANRPLLLVGCGNMGAALLRGWLEAGLDAGSVHSVDPISDPLVPHKLAGVHRDPGVFFEEMQRLSGAPRVVVLAVKPQFMPQVLEDYRGKLPSDCLVLSIAAGLGSEFYREVFGAEQPLVRMMPNTPASVGLGASLLFDAGHTSAQDLELAGALASAVGRHAWVDEEAKIDSLTGVTGSGPAYVFLLIEALMAAAVDQGMAEQDAQAMATQVVLGAAQLASQDAATPPAQHRINVTSPGGVTQAALDVLMKSPGGMVESMVEACRAGTARAVELGKG